ncbi:MAG TPA: hypothetical protein VGF38_03430, partial [Ktedonobacterales bacterium]
AGRPRSLYSNVSIVQRLLGQQSNREADRWHGGQLQTMPDKTRHAPATRPPCARHAPAASWSHSSPA